MKHEQFMHLAIEQAKIAYKNNEVPVGAVIVCNNTVIAKAHNTTTQTNDPTNHAELLCIKQVASKFGKQTLHNSTLYVTLEPCPMCAGAIILAGLQTCYFGASDKRQGCCESIYALTQDPTFYHRTPAIGGLLAEECAKLLVDFFKSKRN